MCLFLCLSTSLAHSIILLLYYAGNSCDRSSQRSSNDDSFTIFTNVHPSPPQHSSMGWPDQGEPWRSFGAITMCDPSCPPQGNSMDRPDQGELWRSLGAITINHVRSSLPKTKQQYEQLRSKYNNVIWLDPGTGTGRPSLKALFPFHKAGWRSL